MPNDDQLGDEVKPTLVKIFAIIDKWQERTNSMPLPVAVGSSLRKDDDVTHPYEVSHGVVGALVSAVDHLHALRVLIQDGHVVHARAPFTLIRAALENAATAVWLLAPNNRDERVLRRLRLQWADSRHAENAQKAIGGSPKYSAADWKAKLEGIAQARGLDEDRMRMVTQKPAHSAIVKEAGDFAPGMEGSDVLFCWMGTSGIAHGQLWAILSGMLDRVEVPGVENVDSATLRLTVSDRALVLMTSVAGLMVAEGWRLFDQRRQRTY